MDKQELVAQSMQRLQAQGEELKLLAEEGDWQRFRDLETNWSQQLKAFLAEVDGAVAKTYLDELAELVELNRELITIVEAKRNQVFEQLKTINVGRKGVKAYELR